MGVESAAWTFPIRNLKRQEASAHWHIFSFATEHMGRLRNRNFRSGYFTHWLAFSNQVNGRKDGGLSPREQPRIAKSVMTGNTAGEVGNYLFSCRRFRIFPMITTFKAQKVTDSLEEYDMLYTRGSNVSPSRWNQLNLFLTVISRNQCADNIKMQNNTRQSRSWYPGSKKKTCPCGLKEDSNKRNPFNQI